MYDVDGKLHFLRWNCELSVIINALKQIHDLVVTHHSYRKSLLSPVFYSDAATKITPLQNVYTAHRLIEILHNWIFCWPRFLILGYNSYSVG